MKVLLINGSPHEFGCTFTALSEVADALMSEGITTEIYYLGNEPIQPCTACGFCRTSPDHACIFEDRVNDVLKRAADVDGLIIGSPVHYAAASGSITTFLDRLFYAGSALFAYKPGAAVVSSRRGGATAALDQLNKYFTISNMPMVSSQYWNMVHGNTPDQVRQDEEGMQVMRVLGRNMAWLLKSIEAGKRCGIEPVCQEQRVRTNFIR